MKKTGLLFLLLTITTAAVLKYCCPQSAEQLREKAGEILSGNMDYSGVISAIGSFIKDEAEGLQQASDEDSVIETMPEDMLQSYRSAMEQWVLALEEDKSSPMQQSNDEDLPPAVSACIAKQLSFAGQSIPKNVRLDMPELPFEYTNPVDGCDSSGFGFREHPIEQKIKFHYGTDLAANGGTAVYAFAEGSVLAVGSDDSYGNYIVLQHPGGAKSLYAHLSRVDVTEGQELEMGETIAQVGATGLATGPHLHFEIMLDNVYLNPEYYI